jgi:hypothetical protein
MKRKPTLIILSLVAAFTLLAVTAFASAPSYEGYEAFKTLASNHEDKGFNEEENATLKGSIKVIDNDVTLVDLEASIKADGPNENFSGLFTIKADGISKEVEVFAEDDLVYVFDEVNNEFYKVNKSEDYNEMQDEDYGRGSFDRDEEINPAQEELLDFIMGELKNDFELVNNSDGSETIKFELTKDEMPMLLNLMFSAMDHDKAGMHGDSEELDAETLAKYPLLSDLSNIKVDMPEITENMELDYVKFAVTTDANDDFQAVEFSFIVTGDDEQGLSHTQQIDGNFAATEVGTTVVDTPDLEGKEIIEVDTEDFHNEDMNMRMGPKGKR